MITENDRSENISSINSTNNFENCRECANLFEIMMNLCKMSNALFDQLIFCLLLFQYFTIRPKLFLSVKRLAANILTSFTASSKIVLKLLFQRNYLQRNFQYVSKDVEFLSHLNNVTCCSLLRIYDDCFISKIGESARLIKISQRGWGVRD